MAHKGRNRTRKNKWLKKSPDEVFVNGPFRLERYGKYTRYVNTLTDRQHAEFRNHITETHKRVVIDLEREVLLLQGVIQECDPLELMHRAVYKLLPLFTKYRSENEYSSEESYFLPAAEYLQYLIARSSYTKTDKQFEESQWNQIWDRTLTVLHLTQTYIITRPTPPDELEEISELRFTLDESRLIMRIKRYPLFLNDHLTSSLMPYVEEIQSIYGVSVHEIVEGLLAIKEYTRIGIADRFTKTSVVIAELINELKKNGHSVGDGIDLEKSFTLVGLKEKYEEMHNELRLALTPELFEISRLTSLPKEFLSLLSVKPGESLLTTITGPDHDDLSPLSTSVLHYKPFLEIARKYYCFYHSGFEDHISEIIEADLFLKKPERFDEMIRKRSNRLVYDTRQLLFSLLNPDFIHENVFYPIPNQPGTLTELDLLIGVDDILFVVEAKGGSLSTSTIRGAPKSVAKDLSDLIIEGQRQSERAEAYIRLNHEAIFFDQTGQREIIRLNQSKYRKVFRLVITREQLGWVGAKIAMLSILDSSLSKSYPWHVSIDDLRVIADLFDTDEIRFLHYLELRLLASAETVLVQHDEIDHIALYNEMNYYNTIPIKDIDRLSYDPSYMRDIDYYFMEKLVDNIQPKPTQKMPSKMRAFISALRSSRLAHRFEVGSILLSMNGSTREEFKSGMVTLDKGWRNGRHLSFRVPFATSAVGVTISYCLDSQWSDELKYSAVQMKQSNCERWLVAQLVSNVPYKISKIEVILPNTFTDTELSAGRQRHEFKTQEKIANNKIGRNDTCPCGSGRKFKFCHGFKD